jgi:hypothetical protein
VPLLSPRLALILPLPLFRLWDVPHISVDAPPHLAILRAPISELQAGCAAIMAGTKKFPDIPVPALVIFGIPHSQGIWVGNSTDPQRHHSP